MVTDDPVAQIQTDRIPSLALVLVVGILVATGVYLLLERSLTRVLLGFVLASNGINLLILLAGGAGGAAPILGRSSEPISDPLAQAMVLTSIVITLALTAFVGAMAYRSWQLYGHDEVQDDIEDRRVARFMAERGEDEDPADLPETAWGLDSDRGVA
ncbi:MAG: Na(+)/H(+) antiporter subunit C [Cellulomonadaceae bacterium]|nr:Na(+)/H(+) antiporter subunit C [Cellulomonadaceae bacterium]